MENSKVFNKCFNLHFKERTIFCVDCNDSMCEDCSKDHILICPDHNINSIEKIIENFQKVTPFIEPLELQEINDYYQNITNKTYSQIHEITNIFRNLRADLALKENQMLRALTNQNNINFHNYSKHYTNLNNLNGGCKNGENPPSNLDLLYFYLDGVKFKESYTKYFNDCDIDHNHSFQLTSMINSFQFTNINNDKENNNDDNEIQPIEVDITQNIIYKYSNNILYRIDSKTNCTESILDCIYEDEVKPMNNPNFYLNHNHTNPIFLFKNNEYHYLLKNPSNNKYEWKSEQTTMNFNFTSTVFDINDIILFGGFGLISKNDIYRFNIQSKNYKKIGSLPVPIHHHNACKDGDRVYIIGGIEQTYGETIPNYSIFEFNLVTNVISKQIKIPFPKHDPKITGNVFGSYVSKQFYILTCKTKEFYRFDPNSNELMKLSPPKVLEEIRVISKLSFNGDKNIYLLGNNPILKYDIEFDKWEALSYLKTDEIPSFMAISDK